MKELSPRFINSFLKSLIIFTLSLAVVSCAAEDEDNKPKKYIPMAPELEPGWTVFRPGGDTICSRGTDYAYYVHPGKVNRIVIDFMGGGACWNAETCALASALFSQEVDPERDLWGVDVGVVDGIYNKENPENPVRDWYHVHLPYCTGDIHWGNAVTTYGEGEDAVTINHKGAINATAVLDWVYDNFRDPEMILITGCSAGAYGSIGWTPHIVKHYPKAQVIQFADSGAGIITDSFFTESFPSWNVDPFLPYWIPGLDPAQIDIGNLSLPIFYNMIAAFYPQHLFSQFNTAYDWNQTLYYDEMKGEGGALTWSEKMYQAVDEIKQESPNFASYIGPGDNHCAILYERFYEVQSDGVKLSEWLGDLIEGVEPYSVDCGDDCGAPSGL